MATTSGYLRWRLPQSATHFLVVSFSVLVLLMLLTFQQQTAVEAKVGVEEVDRFLAAWQHTLFCIFLLAPSSIFLLSSIFFFIFLLLLVDLL